MDLHEEAQVRAVRYETRRHFLHQSTLGLGGLALSSLLGGCTGSGAEGGAREEEAAPGVASYEPSDTVDSPLAPRPPHFAPGAKRVIYLHMAGAPSQLELFDYKPKLQELHGKDCPESLLEGRRFAFIQGTPKMLGPQTSFERYGDSQTPVSELLPHFREVVDEVTFLKAMHTDEFNHAPAQLLMLTGSPRLGRASMGAWALYGLGTENQNLPGYVVMLSGENQPSAGKSAWGSGFLPTVYQGVQCRSEGDPVLYVSNPEGESRNLREKAMQTIAEVNERRYEEVGDPEILSRIGQYEMAFRMQMSVPEIMDIQQEPDYIHDMYGTSPGRASFANNCLLARRLAERDVRFIQLFHWGWDSHGTSESTGINRGFKKRCREVDQPMTALIKDLKQRGMLEETLVVWGGEFGRTPMLENRSGSDNPFTGRDHHNAAFTMWMAGGGLKRGYTHGRTDELGFAPVEGRTSIYDLQATILDRLGMDHEELTYHFKGREFRLTDVHGHVIDEIIA